MQHDNAPLDATTSDTVTDRHRCFEIVDVDFDVVPGPLRRVSYTIVDRFLVVTALDPEPDRSHPDAAIVGRIWPGSGTCRAVANADGIVSTLVLHVDHGRIYERTVVDAPVTGAS